MSNRCIIWTPETRKAVLAGKAENPAVWKHLWGWVFFTDGAEEFHGPPRSVRIGNDGRIRMIFEYTVKQHRTLLNACLDGQVSDGQNLNVNVAPGQTISIVQELSIE